MNLFLTFVIIFVGGPLVFRQIMRIGIGPTPLVVIAASLVIGSIGLRYGFNDLWGSDFRLTLMSLFLIWMAWIVVMALGAGVLRRNMPGLRAKRWTSAIGAAGTTMPWFGLAAASWIEG